MSILTKKTNVKTNLSKKRQGHTRLGGGGLTKLRLYMDSQYVVGFKPQKKHTHKTVHTHLVFSVVFRQFPLGYQFTATSHAHRMCMQ